MDAFGTPSEKQVRPEQSNDQHQAVAALFPVAATRPHLFTRPAEDERLESVYLVPEVRPGHLRADPPPRTSHARSANDDRLSIGSSAVTAGPSSHHVRRGAAAVPSLEDETPSYEDRLYYCHECKRAFTSQKQLSQHIREVCEKTREFQCPHEGCSQTFVRHYRLNDHDWKVHHPIQVCEAVQQATSSPITQGLSCPHAGCARVFFQSSSLRSHDFVVHHPGQPCQPAGSATAVVLKQHHVWACGICNHRLFQSLDGFMQHHIIHCEEGAGADNINSLQKASTLLQQSHVLETWNMINSGLVPGVFLHWCISTCKDFVSKLQGDPSVHNLQQHTTYVQDTLWALFRTYQQEQTAPSMSAPSSLTPTLATHQLPFLYDNNVAGVLGYASNAVPLPPWSTFNTHSERRATTFSPNSGFCFIDPVLLGDHDQRGGSELLPFAASSVTSSDDVAAATTYFACKSHSCAGRAADSQNLSFVTTNPNIMLPNEAFEDDLLAGLGSQPILELPHSNPDTFTDADDENYNLTPGHTPPWNSSISMADAITMEAKSYSGAQGGDDIEVSLEEVSRYPNISPALLEDAPAPYGEAFASNNVAVNYIGIRSSLATSSSQRIAFSMPAPDPHTPTDLHRDTYRDTHMPGAATDVKTTVQRPSQPPDRSLST